MARSEQLTTLCYLERDGKYLMMHRTSKEHDINKDKWIGVGGHFEENESPEECIKREIYEETGYDIPMEDLEFRALITFISQKGDYELMSLFTAPAPEGEPKPCDEGELVWVDKKEVLGLNLWVGDRIFFKELDRSRDFFSLKMTYDRQDNLIEAVMNGRTLDLNSMNL